ncbi:MAG: hypothetical protein IRZ16_11560 [Myxococcaceae bacterium]|nr:hypothetical protein [Myxococcaceae bacterium]
MWAGARTWAQAYRVEIALFLVCFVVFAFFSSQRFLRQSAAPHFVYQAKAWLEGRLNLEPYEVQELRFEDTACVRMVNGEPVRCTAPLQPGDRWYSSFPAFPAVVMLPFVALHGYQFNDTSFTVIVGALAIALFYSLLRFLAQEREIERSRAENIALALVLAFGTLFFYCTLRGEVWFTAEVMGVALTCLYLRNSVRARRPVLAGLFYSMAVLTRTPLLFAGAFFVVEALRLPPTEGAPSPWPERLRRIGLFAVGAAPIALLAAWFNQVRFGRITEFGHRFFFNNRVNADIDTWGLFNVHYLGRNLEAAFLKLPQIQLHPFRLSYDPHGLSLLLTLPLIVFLLWPRSNRRLQLPLWIALAATALPGLLYQNDGYAQFGFRFSLDYTPYLLLLFAASGWSLKDRWVQAAIALGVLVNFWGAVAFRGFTEAMRGW